MKEKVERFIRSCFPVLIDLKIEENSDVYWCTFNYYCSDIYGNPFMRTMSVKVGVVEGFFKIVD